MVSSHLGAVAVSLFSCLLLTANNVVNALPGGGPVDDTPKTTSLPVTLPSTKTSTAIAGPTSSPLPPLFFGAIAVLTPTANSTVRGTVIFQQLPWANNRLTVANNPDITIEINLTGLTPGTSHGIHVHEFGDISNPAGLASALHFTGGGKHNTHRCPATTGDDAGMLVQGSHPGDIGNIKANANGEVKAKFRLGRYGVTFDTEDPRFFLGRAVVVHEKADDCKTQPTGNSGARLAQGVIGYRLNSTIPGSTKRILGSTTDALSIAVLHPTAKNTVRGVALFSQRSPSSPVTLRLLLRGLLPSKKYGLHLHAFGDLSDLATGGLNAGLHFNPFKKPHACSGKERHAGDLSNIKSDSKGNVDVTIKSDLYNIYSNANDAFAAGRAIVIHENPDDCTSQPVGNSGKRLALGVVGLRANGKEVTTKEALRKVVGDAFASIVAATGRPELGLPPMKTKSTKQRVLEDDIEITYGSERVAEEEERFVPPVLDDGSVAFVEVDDGRRFNDVEGYPID